MLGKDIRKAKAQGLTDEQIVYFLQRYPDPSRLLTYANFILHKCTPEEALAKVVIKYGYEIDHIIEGEGHKMHLD